MSRSDSFDFCHITVTRSWTSGQYQYKCILHTTWQVSTSNKYLSNIPVLGTWFNIAANNYNFQDHGTTSKL